MKRIVIDNKKDLYNDRSFYMSISMGMSWSNSSSEMTLPTTAKGTPLRFTLTLMRLISWYCLSSARDASSKSSTGMLFCAATYFFRLRYLEKT